MSYTTATATAEVPETSANGRYVLRSLLPGQTGAVTCIAAHPLGTHIACGGQDGTRIWDLQAEKLLRSPAGAGDRGVTTAVAWMIRPDDTEDGLAFGTDDGYLVIWRRSRADDEFTEVYCNRLDGGEYGQEVSGIAFDPTSSQLAVVHRAESVHRFVIDPAMRLTPIKSVAIKMHWPQTVAFGQTTARGPEIWSFGREDGEIHVLDEGGRVTTTKPTGTVIGGAAISVKDDAFILDDASQGVALFKLSASERLKTFAVASGERRSRNVCFHDGGRAIITGSDHGNVYVFDRRTGEVSDVIDIGVRDWVQSIATTEIDGVPVIIIGRSGERIGKVQIQVWERNRTTVTVSEEEPRGRPARELQWWQVVCVILSILFILQNMPTGTGHFMKEMAGPSKPLYSLEDITRDPTTLTVFANPEIPPKSFDGVVGNHVGDVLVSTPNMNILFRPPLNDCRVRMRRDRHFGPDDPLYFPQPFNRGSAHLAVIQIPQSSPDHPFSVAWMVPDESHFEPSLDAFCAGFGTLNIPTHCKLSFLHDTVLESIPRGKEDDPFIRTNREQLRRLMDRLKLSAPMDEIFIRFKCAQRLILELDARIRWLTSYRERYETTGSCKDHPGLADSSLMGAFTSDLDVLESLFQCRIPVYFVRPLSRSGNSRIDQVPHFLSPYSDDTFELPSGFTVNLSDAVPAHRVIFTGLASNPERYVAMGNYVTCLLDYPSPLGSSQPRSSTSMQRAALPLTPPYL
ncbi:hypothetical protein AAF712_009969 [Marasmius tenuissimus]|uniref:Uncharacterized protein n=1 Tax=Marasmius tenuissimus TaxID=585030 RepID=A0ABR2ZPE3_9AGAR